MITHNWKDFHVESSISVLFCCDIRLIRHYHKTKSEVNFLFKRMSIYWFLLFQILSVAPRNTYMQRRTAKIHYLEEKNPSLTWNIIRNDASN